MKRKKQDTAWETPASRAAVPIIPCPARASVDAKKYAAVLRVIRQIAVPTDRGEMTCECKRPNHDGPAERWIRDDVNAVLAPYLTTRSGTKRR